jgi:hypothetical protein
MTPKQKSAKEAHRVLVKGLRALNKTGVWIKGVLGEDEHGHSEGNLAEAPHVCSLGAIGKALGVNAYRDTNWYINSRAAQDGTKYLASAINCRTSRYAHGSPDGTVVAFNDHNDTTEKDLKTVWKVAIALAKKDARGTDK